MLSRKLSVRSDGDITRKPVGMRDAFIVAQVKVLGLALVTDNTREFFHVEGLSLEDWIS